MDVWERQGGLSSSARGRDRSPFEVLAPVLFFLGGIFAIAFAGWLIQFMPQHKSVFLTCSIVIGLAMYKAKKKIPVLYGDTSRNGTQRTLRRIQIT